MEIRERAYTYPVLSYFNDDYVNSSFTVEKLTVDESTTELTFTLEFVLKDKKIESLINDGTFEYVIHAECSKTCFREIYRTRNSKYTFNIRKSMLKAKLEICFFIISTKNLENYSNENFNPDYLDAKFDIQKGNEVAIAEQKIFEINTQDDLSKISSIFLIDSCENAHFRVNLDENKIVISLDKDSFSIYKKIKDRQDKIPILISMIIVPSMIYVFECIKKEEQGSYSDHNWFKSIKKILEINKIDLDDVETFKDIPTMELVQKIFDFPINSSLKMLSLDDCNNEEED